MSMNIKVKVGGQFGDEYFVNSNGNDFLEAVYESDESFFKDVTGMLGRSGSFKVELNFNKSVDKDRRVWLQTKFARYTQHHVESIVL